MCVIFALKNPKGGNLVIMTGNRVTNGTSFFFNATFLLKQNELCIHQTILQLSSKKN